MNESLHLGRVSGIRLSANWSLLPIFLLISWTLAAALLPSAAPGYATWGYWLFGVLTAAAFYACLVAHELAHALVARRHGVEVKSIVLWLFGGVAQLRGDTPSARAELQVAAAGPAASLAIAGISALLSWLLGQVGVSSLLVESLAWLAGINIVLAVFNLLPAFPLDGGRILRALLWRHWGDRVRATTAAAMVGTVGGFVLVGIGMLELLAGGALGGIWLALVGWFITVAARQQRDQVKRRSDLGDMRVADAMTSDPLVVPASSTVADVIERHVRAVNFSSFPIGDPYGRIVGMTTVERMARLPRASWSSMPVTTGAASAAEIVWCGQDEPLAQAAGRMESSADRRVLVAENGHLVGILTPSDVARAVNRADLFGRAAGTPRDPAAPRRGWPGAGRGTTWGPASQT